MLSIVGFVVEFVCCWVFVVSLLLLCCACFCVCYVLLWNLCVVAVFCVRSL